MLNTCDKCQYWNQVSGLDNEAYWGECSAPRRASRITLSAHRLTTHKEFGCIMHEPREADDILESRPLEFNNENTEVIPR